MADRPVVLDYIIGGGDPQADAIRALQIAAAALAEALAALTERVAALEAA